MELPEIGEIYKFGFIFEEDCVLKFTNFVAAKCPSKTPNNEALIIMVINRLTDELKKLQQSRIED